MTIDFFTSTGLSASTDVPAFAYFPVPAGFIFFPHAGLLFVQDMTKPFFIGKLIIGINNITS